MAARKWTGLTRFGLLGEPGTSFVRVWLVAFGLLVMVIEVWSLATPIDGAPDERVQFVKAAAVVRGQWLGSEVRGSPPAFTAVRVPSVYADPGTGGCFIGHPTVAAGCPTGVHPASSKTVSATTYVGHYPPLYYLLVGWPSVFGTKSSLYLIRAMSAVVNAAMLALAIATAWRWSRSALLLPALAVAVTPMVVFLSSVVNPSGLEITAAIAMWTAAATLVIDHPRQPPAGLIAVLGVSTSVLVLMRGLSPLWPVVCVIILLPLAWSRLDIRAMFARRAVRLAGGGVVVAGVAAVAWIVLANGLAVVAMGVPSARASRVAIARVVAGENRGLIRQAIGDFGWADTPAPLLTDLIWVAAGGGLVMLAVVVGYKRHLASIALAIGLTAALPFVLSNLTARHSGLIAQGRYFLPLAVAIPILAGAASSQLGLPRRATGRVTMAIVWLAALGQIAAAAWALRRYLVGVNGSILPTAVGPGVWHPPLPGWVLDLLFVAAWTGLAVLFVRLSPRPRREPTDGQTPRQEETVVVGQDAP